jgi:PAS domain S-box-containing protein
MCESLSSAGGMALAVLEVDGKVLAATGWEDICTRFHREHPETVKHCLESDLRINEHFLTVNGEQQPYAYRCPNGLWDVAHPLVVEGEHLANVFTGQFFFDDEEVDESVFRERALALGFDETAYMEALARVPVVSHARAELMIAVVADVVAMLGELGLGGLRRQRAEDAIAISHRLYETFFDATDDMVFLKDEDLRYVLVNAANARYLGLAAQEVVGRDDTELMPPDAAASCRSTDLAALEQHRLIVSCEEVDGRVYETRKFPVVLPSGRVGLGGFVRDITDQRRAEEQIARLNTDLEVRVALRTAELEAANHELESFAYSVSHDLRAPLRSIDGFSEILAEDYRDKLDEKGRGYLKRIRAADQKMALMIDGLLALSRVGRRELECRAVDLSAVAREVADQLRTNEPLRRVEFVIGDGLVAEADSALVRVLLENLIGNAWRFSGRHPAARIEVGVDEFPGRAPATRSERAFFVRDDGAGFDMEYSDQLFGAFQRLHAPGQFEGTGIGLATVQRIVHRHGGRVWARGEVEKGATFWFTLLAANGPPG